MAAADSIKVHYDLTTKRVNVSRGDRRVSLPGTYQDLEEARRAAEVYAKRWLTEE